MKGCYEYVMGDRRVRDDLTRVLMSAAKTAEQRVRVQPGWAQRMMSDMGM